MRLGGGALRRAFGRGAAALLVLGTHTCLGVLRHLGDTNDSVSPSDLEAGGACEEGCVRTVVNADAQGVGEVDCALRVQNLLDHYDEDVVGSALNVVHSCTNEDGDLLYQDQGACLYSVCVTAEWRTGTVFYSVVVEHEAPIAAHTVLVQVYMNEYENLVHVSDESFASSAPSSSVQCQLGTTCPEASDCGTDGVRLTVLLEDDYGDGWVGALPDRANIWALTQALSSSELASPVADGTLPDRHYSGATQLCLEDGLYTFSTTADAAWSEEASWTVCGVTGGAGGALEFEIGGGECSVVDDSSAGGPPDTSADTPTEDVCSMPTESPCVSLDLDVREISGPAVGMYYDEACLEGGGGETGCGGGGEPACRVCFVNRDFWLADFPDERYPDWVDCPCCVAADLGVTCQEGEPVVEPEESLLEQAQDFYWEGSTPLLAGLCGLIGLGLITACCCCREIRKTNQKALTFKHHKTAGHAGYNDGNDDTSPDVTPPSRDSYKRSGEFPAKHGENDHGDHDQDLEAVIVPTKKTKKKKHRPLSRGKPPRGGGAQDDVGHIPADASDSPDLFEYGGDGTLAPRPLMTALPGAAKDRPPSDASWPSDPRVGVSVSGKKNPRWSGSKELKAYLRRTGYDEMGNGESQQQQQQQQQQQRSGKRRSGDKHAGGRGGGGGVVRALKKKGSSLLGEKKSSRNEFEWVDDAGQRPDGEAEIAAAPYPDGVDGPAVSMGYIDGLGLGEDFAVPPTGVVGGPRSRPKSRSRSKSRDRSHRRAGDVGGGGSGGGRGARRKSGGRARNAAPFEGSGSVSARSISSLLSGGSKSKPRRVAPTDEDEAAADGSNADEFGLCDRSFLDKTWQAPPGVSEPEFQEDVTRRHDAPIASEVHRGRGAARRSKSRGRGRGNPASNVAVVMEDAVDSGRVRALKAERRREEEDKLRAEEARKRMDEEERAELERVREVRRREEEEEEERRRKKKQERLRRQQAEEQERIAAEEQERAERAWQEQQQQQQQQQLEEEERSRRRRKQQSRQPHRNASRERDENGGGGGGGGHVASRGRGRSADERKKRGDEGGSRDRPRGARGRSVEEAAAVVDPWDASESNRARGERTRGESREERDRRRGVSSSGRTQQPRGGGDRSRDGGDAPVRGSSTPAGPRESELRESEAERRRRRSREAQERRPSQSRSQERQKGSRSRERRAAGSGSVPRGGSSSGRRSSRSPKREEVAEVAAPELGRKKSGGTRFSSDPRAKQERAARLKEKRMKASAGQEN